MTGRYTIVGLILLIFFVISLLQNMLGPLIPDIINDFNLSLTLAGFLPFSFFIAYAVMSIPTGFLVEKFREKTVLLIAFSISFLGAFLFATHSSFASALLSLFLMGMGVAMMQVAINPLLRVSGGEKHFAFNSVLAQLIFGLASFISPKLFVYFVQNLNHGLSPKNGIIKLLELVVPENLPWISLYWVFVLITVLMIITIALVRFPKVELTEDERVGQMDSFVLLFKNRTVILYFLGIVAYVGTEQGVADWISKFLVNYHQFDPQTVGARVVSNFWGLMTIGCLLGLLLLKIYDSRKVLIFFSFAAIISLTIGLFGSGNSTLIVFPLVGFFASVMWSIIFSLALNSVSRHHGTFSGILCTGICGGAIVPVIIGWLGSMFGLRVGMMFLYLTLGYILSIGFWAKPLISNETIREKRNAARISPVNV
jgi:FHS family L-fucose permease-like MFS transporter